MAEEVGAMVEGEGEAAMEGEADLAEAEEVTSVTEAPYR